MTLSSLWRKKNYFFLAAAAHLAGCRTPQPGADLPAVVVNPTPESRAELVRAISAALDGATVMLADDAFTTESGLAIERPPLRDPNGLLAQGRERAVPEQLRLVKSGAQCVLVHQRTGRRYPLSGVACEPK